MSFAALKTKISNIDRFIKVLVHTECYLGFCMNVETSAAGGWILELKLLFSVMSGAKWRLS